MKKILNLTSLALALSIGGASAQVNDVSITVTPQIGYNWFDKKSTVEDGTMYGFQVGFGFGKVMELRGVWERSLNLKQNFGKYESDINELFPNFNFADRSIKVQRIGGEFKTNIPVGGFSPYLILGTGVQNFKTTLASGVDYENENLYGSGGLGFKISLGDRTTLNLEGRGIAYNMNPNSLLYDEGGSSDFDEWINSTDRSAMYNWSLMAGLQFYFGGRNDQNLDALDRAYLSRFSGGLGGTKLTLSPGGAYVKFNNNSPYRDSYFLGGVLGLDFSHYAGIQGYYYRSTRDEEISFDFDDLELFGADFVGKLNVPRGIVPFITVGGGYLNVNDDYAGKPIVQNGAILGNQAASSGYFAKGGVGVEIPLSNYIQVFGGASIMYTMQDQDAEVTDLRNANQLHSHTMYNAGLRLNIGKSSNTNKAANRAFDNRFKAERSEYDAQIESLELQLKEALKNNDTKKAIAVIEEKKVVDSIQSEGKSIQKVEDSRIRLTPEELEKLIDRVIDGVNKQEELSVEDRLKRIETLLIQGGNNTRQLYIQPTTTETTQQLQGSTVQQQAKDVELEALRKELQDIKREMQNQRSTPQTGITIQQPTTNTTPVVTAPLTTNGNTVVTAPIVTESHLKTGITPYIGVNFGDASTFNAGIRGYYGLQNTSIMLMPEAYLAVGNGVGFGLSGNAVLPFQTNTSGITPFVGVGVGIHSLGNDFRFATNVLGGVAYQLGRGKLTADYTIRGAFRNNQIAVGYRFGI